MEIVGARLRALRKEAGLTQTQLAQQMGSNQSAINRYESGATEAPYRVLLWYADHFGVTTDYLLCRTDERQGQKNTPQAPQGAAWEEFIEACFEPGSELNQRLKQMLLALSAERQGE